MAFEALFLCGDVVAGLLGLLARSPDDDARAREETRRRDAIRVTLEALAEALPGRHHKPLLRAPRVTGFLEGRPVTLIWRGADHVELRGVAPPGLQLEGGVGGWIQRRLFGPIPWALGVGPASELLELLRAGHLDRVSVHDGTLVAMLRPGLNVQRILALTRSVLGLLWTPPPAPVVVAMREPAPSAAPSPRGDQEHRCPFCHDAIPPQAVVVHCASCDAPHHPTCFEEGHGCAIAGCHQAKARGARARA